MFGTILYTKRLLDIVLTFCANKEFEKRAAIL